MDELLICELTSFQGKIFNIRQKGNQITINATIGLLKLFELNLFLVINFNDVGNRKPVYQQIIIVYLIGALHL